MEFLDYAQGLHNVHYRYHVTKEKSIVVNYQYTSFLLLDVFLAAPLCFTHRNVLW
jgi:hypothetical protein